MRAVDVRHDGRTRHHAGMFPLLYLISLAAILFAIYRPAWNIPPYADDFHVLLAAEVGIRGGAFDGEFMFRPIELFVLQASLALQGDVALARAISFAGFLASVALVFWLGQRMAPEDPITPFLAATLFGVHSLNVVAVSQIDTVSQQYATVMTLAMFGWYLFGPRERRHLYHAGGAGFILLALLSKEAAVGVVFALPFALAVVEVVGRGRAWRAALRQSGMIFAYAAALFGLYMLLRHQAGAILLVEEGIERYTFELTPLNVLENMVLLLGGPAWLGSTLEVFLLGSPLRLAISAFFTAAFNGLALLGLVLALLELRHEPSRARTLAPIGATAIMLVASLFPISITGWPGELHAYLVTPFYVLIASFFAWRGWRALSAWLPLAARPAHALGLAGFALCCAWLLFGVNEKLAWSAGVGARSAAFLQQASAWYAAGEPASDPPLTCVAEAPGPRRLYSVFAMPDYSLLKPMTDWLNHRHGARLLLPLFPDEVACEAVIDVRGDVLEVRRLTP